MNRNYCISNFKNENLTDYNRVSKVSALFDSQPELLYKNPYINFLREFRIRHLDLNIPELYHEAANAWIQLSKKEKLGFRCLDIIKDIKQRRAMKRRFEVVKKWRKPKKKIFNPRRIMRRKKKEIIPITKIRGRRQRRQTKTAEKLNKEKRRVKKPSKNIQRVERMLNRLKMINNTAKTGRRPRRSVRRSPRLRRLRRQIKRRK
ncbi:uncharacterized protein LOC129947900 [Eupeodes corollae]|uniref:uncharacterized protein LOC129947900 n=1 Tax=Eupeodes corollae TaxID=290404 RepID=UPI002493CE47|nr:uncharacterized protein LOC129947900 [Eupeodes corollae]